MRKLCSVIIFMLLFCLTLRGDDFFEIKSVKFYKEENPSGVEVTKIVEEEEGKRVLVRQEFIEVRVSAKKRTRFDSVFAKVYFYDSNRKYLVAAVAPDIATRLGKGKYSLPAFFDGGKTESLFFIVPEEVNKHKNWNALAVFGDYNGITAKLLTEDSIAKYSFSEKYYLNRKSKSKRVDALNPIVEHVIKTSTEVQPTLTLLCRPSLNGRQSKGVFAVCMLANSVEDMKKNILSPPEWGELNHIMEFARKHDLALLCWGARRLWDPSRNWDEQSKEEYKKYDDNFDEVAKAWRRGVDKLCEEYKLPNNKFLLWGTSAAAQYAMRIAIRYPEYFNSVCLHIPSSFDKPSKGGRNILWCITTGEREAGYSRSVKFFNECKSLGYPIIYKAIPGLGHSGHRGAREFAIDFCEYAYTSKLSKEQFINSQYYGDLMHQIYYPAASAGKIPESFKVSLPTKEMAEKWKGM
jgi:hypothetical protein vspiD_18370|nr:MAG TPA: Prolyl oligopeptidase family [Caudoviricetes sp.]